MMTSEREILHSDDVREIDRQTETQRKTQRETHTHTETEILHYDDIKETDRQTDRDTERFCTILTFKNYCNERDSAL